MSRSGGVRRASSGARRSPYKVLRTPSRMPVAAPDQGEPPAPSTPMNANCEPPVKARTDSAQVCRTVRPDVTPIAP